MSARRRYGLLAAGTIVLVLACAPPAPETPTPEQQAAALPPRLPDETGWGVHVLSVTRAPGGALWAGTHGHGLLVLRRGVRTWERLPADDATAPAAITSVAAQAADVVWYGTAGDGFAVTHDGGATFRRWTDAELGARWLYVAPNGIRIHGDTVYIATTDGIRITSDAGATWRCVQAFERIDDGAARQPDGCTERVAALPSPYVFGIDLGPAATIWASHLRGISYSRDGGRSWQSATANGDTIAIRVRAITVNTDSVVWAATEQDVLVDSAGDGAFRRARVRPVGWDALPGATRAIIPSPAGLAPAFAQSAGLAVADAAGRYRIYYLAAADTYRPAADIWSMVWWGPPLWPLAAASTGLNRILAGETPFATPPRPAAIARAAPPPEPWLLRPIADADGNPYGDATYEFAATRYGQLPPRHGIGFLNPAGTPVRAVASGVVVFAGVDVAGSQTIALQHDAAVAGQVIYSVYRHNRALHVATGARVAAGAVIAAVGSTGAARGVQLGLELHAAPITDPAPVVDPPAFAPHAVNPRLWIEPRPGTGVVAGRVRDAHGAAVRGARVYGLVLPYPHETPFSFAETYGEQVSAHPHYGEDFAVGDVPAGDYVLGVEIGGVRVWRRVVVAPGLVTFVEFAP